MIHHEAIGQFEELLRLAAARPHTPCSEAAGGNVVLLKAPRAGYGKSHLMARLRHQVADSAWVLPMNFDPDRDQKWSILFWQALDHLHQAKTGQGPLSLLDLLARRVFAVVNQHLILEKRVPCAHPEEALAGLEQRYVELFDFQNPAQPVARWFAEHFERLLPVTGRVLAQAAGIRDDEATAWLRVLCGYAQGLGDGDAVRLEGLRWAVQQPVGAPLQAGGISVINAGTQGDAGFKDRFATFCRIASVCRPILLVLDHLDTFHGDRERALRIAWMSSEMSRLLPRAVVVVSVNEDLWTETFLRAVPSAIEDRLTGAQIALSGIGREEAEDLLRTRLRHAETPQAEADAFMARFSLGDYYVHAAGRPVSPRTLLRSAAEAWDYFQKERRPGAAAVAAEFPQTSLRVEDGPYFNAGPRVTAMPETPATAPHGEPATATPGGGNADSFRKLRVMLERMKSRPEANGSEPHTAPAPSPAPAPVAFTAAPGRSTAPVTAPPGAETALRSAPGGGTPSPLTSGVVLPEPVRPAPPPDLLATVPVPATTPHDRAVQVRFHTLRAHFSAAPYLLVDQDRIFHLLKLTGNRLAVVRYTELPLPTDTHLSAGVWQVPDGEILFGTEPYEDRIYWSQLIAFARHRAGLSEGPRPLAGAGATLSPGCRLVVFSSSQAPVNLTAWMRPDEIVHARARFLDIQTVDQPTLAVLYAADEVLHEAESGRLNVPVADAFQALVPHIDFLWRRVTRPLK